MQLDQFTQRVGYLRIERAQQRRLFRSQQLEIGNLALRKQ